MSAPRPPLRTVLAYRLLDRRPDERYDEWLRDDVDSRWFPLRRAWSRMVFGAAVGAAVVGTHWLPWPLVLAAFVGGVGVDLVSEARGRSRVRARLFPERAPALGPWLPYRGLDDAEHEAPQDGR